MDYLQIESTYGGREHAVRQDADDTVCQLVGGALNQKGKVIIPSFSVGRTQQIVYVLHELTLRRQVCRASPIFVDSPLSVNATEIYRKHPECCNDASRHSCANNENPFGMANLTYISDAEDSKKLNDRKEPMIIISASGMCEGGPHPASFEEQHRRLRTI